MSSSFWLLPVESHNFSQVEKERTACKAEQIHKMITIFGSCKVTWATKQLSSLYEIAQVSLQVQSKDCLKVRIFFCLFINFFFVIRTLFIISFQIKKRMKKRLFFFHSKKSNNEIQKHQPRLLYKYSLNLVNYPGLKIG